jgi:hypothetical protein
VGHHNGDVYFISRHLGACRASLEANGLRWSAVGHGWRKEIREHRWVGAIFDGWSDPRLGYGVAFAAAFWESNRARFSIESPYHLDPLGL